MPLPTRTKKQRQAAYDYHRDYEKAKYRTINVSLPADQYEALLRRVADHPRCDTVPTYVRDLVQADIDAHPAPSIEEEA